MALSSAINNNGIVVETALNWNNLAIKDMEKSAQLGLFRLGYAIAGKARSNAPVLTGALRNSIRVEEDGYDVFIRAGGTVVGNKTIDYAYKREMENRLHPNTTHYMKRAHDSEMAGDWQRYFKEELK